MKQVIGIVGGGQLGRMLVEAAHELGFQVAVLDPTPESPAGQIADKQIIGDFKNPQKIEELAAQSDYITFEIELADSATLNKLVAQGAQINPSPWTLSLIKNKFEQKKFLAAAGIPVAEFMEVNFPEDAAEAGRRFGYPFLLKAKFDAYDGRGNIRVDKEGDITASFDKLSGRELYAEKFVPFDKELAVVAARSKTGDIHVYPVVETVQRNHICREVLAPAPIPVEAHGEAEELARKALEHLEGAGVFGIELFWVAEGPVAGKILVNEIAPRVHNSGHFTIEGCITSQFEQHIRAVSGMHLGETKMKVPAAVMVNILGDRTGPSAPKGAEEAEKIPGVKVHIYGKHETRPERKMGHLTAVSLTLDTARKNAQTALARISI